MLRLLQLTMFLGFIVWMNAAPAAESLIQLPAPQTDGGRPLMQALRARSTVREFDPGRELTTQTLSNLLWAAGGVNRPESGKRTVPSAMDAREVDVYVATRHGFYRYEPVSHALRRIVPGDLREQTGSQSYVRDAPITLVYVADYKRLAKAPEAERPFYAAVDTGFISQNVYLFAASEGLATVVRAGVDREQLSRTVGLAPEQHITLVQCVGHPKSQ